MQQRWVPPSVPRRTAAAAAVVTFVAALVVLEAEQRRFAERVSGGAPVATLLAARDLEPGAVLDASALSVIRVPSSYLDARRVLERDRPRVIGRAVGTAVKSGEALVWSDVVTADGPTRLSLLVRAGRRAVQLSPSVNTLGALLRPGDRVDVLLGTEGHVEVLLEDLRVLAVGSLLQDRSRAGEKESNRSRAFGTGPGAMAHGAMAQGVTLDVSGAEAETLFSGERRGALRLVLRHPQDSEVTRRELPREPAAVRTTGSAKEIEHVR